MSNVVVGYDGSPTARRALEYAAAHANGGKLFVVTAVDPPPEWAGAPIWQEIINKQHSRGQELLDEAAKQLPNGTDYATELLEGSAAEAIVNVAEARDADAIVIGSRGLGRVRAALGSVSHDVLHLAARPVVVIPARAPDDKEEGS